MPSLVSAMEGSLQGPAAPRTNGFALEEQPPMIAATAIRTQHLVSVVTVIHLATNYRAITSRAPRSGSSRCEQVHRDDDGVWRVLCGCRGQRKV